jgi:hypothetical protein
MPPVKSNKLSIICGAVLGTSIVCSTALAQPLNSGPTPPPSPGLGLHSYGFMDQAFGTLMTFIASQVAVMALGMLPLKYWRGIRGAINNFSVACAPGASIGSGEQWRITN